MFSRPDRATGQRKPAIARQENNVDEGRDARYKRLICPALPKQTHPPTNPASFSARPGGLPTRLPTLLLSLSNLYTVPEQHPALSPQPRPVRPEHHRDGDHDRRQAAEQRARPLHAHALKHLPGEEREPGRHGGPQHDVGGHGGRGPVFVAGEVRDIFVGGGGGKVGDDSGKGRSLFYKTYMGR